MKLRRSSNYNNNNSNNNDIHNINSFLTIYVIRQTEKTVPKILSTVRSLRPRAEIKTDKC